MTKARDIADFAESITPTTGGIDFGDWTITESSGALYFATGGTNKVKLAANGSVEIVASVDANVTIS